jgi:hypothetical protein
VVRKPQRSTVHGNLRREYATLLFYSSIPCKLPPKDIRRTKITNCVFAYRHRKINGRYHDTTAISRSALHFQGSMLHTTTIIRPTHSQHRFPSHYAVGQVHPVTVWLMIFSNLENPSQPTLFVSAPKTSRIYATNSTFFMQAASTRSFTPLSRSWRALKYQVYSSVTIAETSRKQYLMAALHFADPANYGLSAIWRVCDERKSKGGIGHPRASIGA